MNCRLSALFLCLAMLIPSVANAQMQEKHRIVIWEISDKESEEKVSQALKTLIHTTITNEFVKSDRFEVHEYDLLKVKSNIEVNNLNFTSNNITSILREIYNVDYIVYTYVRITPESTVEVKSRLTNTLNNQPDISSTIIESLGNIAEFDCGRICNKFFRNSEKNDDLLREPAFVKVEIMPSFLGGDVTTFRVWVISQFRIPEIAAENGIQGKVIVQFAIDKCGYLTDIEIIQSPDPVYDDAIINLLEKSPRWIPGYQQGSPVKVRYVLRFDCKLQ